MILTIIVIVMVIATIAVEKCKGPTLEIITAVIIIIITSAMKNQVDVFELI